MIPLSSTDLILLLALSKFRNSYYVNLEEVESYAPDLLRSDILSSLEKLCGEGLVVHKMDVMEDGKFLSFVMLYRITEEGKSRISDL